MAWWIFQSLVTTAALAALVAVVCRFGRIAPVARHALWVLVLMKFVMPPIVVWPWPAPDPLRLARSAPHGIGQGPARDDTPVVAAGELSPPADMTEIVPASDLPSLVSPPVIDATSAWMVLAFVWLVGSLCLGAVEVVRQVRLARRVRMAAPADSSITRRVRELASELGVTPMAVVAVTGSTSPAVWCLGRPRLLWPADLRSDSQTCIDGIIVHELAHLKRRDHLVGWLELVAGLVWWWNPLFWSVRRALREQAELACDAWVISALPDGRRAYAESLLALSSAGAPAPPPMAAVLGVRASSRRVLERRLVMIMHGRASLRLPSAGLLALALLAAATLPAWATAAGDDSQQPPPAIQQIPATQQTQVTQKAQPQPTKSKSVVKLEPQVQPVIKGEKVTHTLSVKPMDLSLSVTPLELSQAAKVIQKRGITGRYSLHVKPEALTEEGQKLVTDYSTDLEAIQKEMQAKTEARREAVIQSLQALQDQYTKAGRLDEAVAIRDYLKAGGPGRSHFPFVFVRERKK